jgi:hypothetical protein
MIMTLIRLTHSVDVDKCIAHEIRELTNKHNILTIYSCCGHKKGKRDGCIVVSPYSIADMQKLGYEFYGIVRTTGTISTSLEELITHLRKDTKSEEYYKFPSFGAKSVCKGRCDHGSKRV